MKLFVFGLGYSARAVVARLRPQLQAAWGTTRDPARLAEIAALGVAPILFDGDGAPPSPPRAGHVQCGTLIDSYAIALPPRGERVAGPADRLGESHSGDERGIDDPSPSPFPQGGGELAAALGQASHLLVSIAPDAAGDPVLRHFGAALAAARPLSIVYLSTIGVYGDHGGAWVDERSACRPVSKRSRQRLAAEAAWQDFGRQTGVPVAIVRLAGIYGPGRGPFEKIRAGTARRIVKPGQVFNRIHVDDIARIVAAAFPRRADGIFNGADDEPAPPQEVLAYAAGLLGVPPPREIPFDEADLTPMARSFYGENKRVRNDRIKRDLGVRLAYPTYRDGLAAVLAAEAGGREPASPKASATSS